MRHPNTAASNQLLINLAVLINKPTGITTYAANLFPHLQGLNPTLLVAQALDNYTCYPVPPNLTPAHGTKGHLRRLLWTQLQLPQIYKNLRSRLLFSSHPRSAPVFQLPLHCHRPRSHSSALSPTFSPDTLPPLLHPSGFSWGTACSLQLYRYCSGHH